MRAPGRHLVCDRLGGVGSGRVDGEAQSLDGGTLGARQFGQVFLDGRRSGLEGRLVTVGWRPDYATLVQLADGETRLTGLRRRGLVLDSPRALVRGARSPEGAEHRAGHERTARP